MILLIFLRSLVSQAVWNTRKMQNIGFLWTIWPVLKKIYPDKNELRAAARRHLDFFNTHPYFIGIFAGLTVHWEKKNRELVSKVKVSYGGPMAALGTQFFWSTLRPLAGMIAILMAWSGQDFAIGAPLMFLIIYNGVHIPVRYYLVHGPSKIGLDFFYLMKRSNPNKMIWYLQLIGVLTAVFAGLMYLGNISVDNFIMFAKFFVGIIVSTLMAHIFFKMISGLQIFYFVVLGGIIISLLGLI